MSARAIAFAFSLLPMACATDDIVVATLPEAAPPGDGSGCLTNYDCEPIEFCARRDCGDARGECALRDVLCEDQGEPTCGCDGVTYWNDCLRRQYGATGSTAGSCTSGAATCMADNALDCPTLGAACAKLVMPGLPCDDQMLGACWVLPVACPMLGMPPDLWSACGGPMECRDTCGAIRSGRPFRHDLMHQCSPDFPGP